MADAGVSMVLNRLAPLIKKRVGEEVSLLLDAEKEAQSLSAKLKKIHEVLADAEQKGVADPRVKRWLEKLQEIAYDIDDALDDWELENIRQKLEDDANSHGESSDLDSWEKKVSVFLQSICSCLGQTVQRRTIALDIKGIHERLDSLAQENENEFNFIPSLGPDSKGDCKRVITSSFVEVSKIHGRDDDKETLVSKLLPEDTSGDGVQTISVVGIGGMGKTSLAQLVFNDISVKNQFQFNIWVCVSNPFDEIKIAKAILEVTDRDSSNLTQPQTLLQSIEKSISGKKFLLVFDDVWEDDDSKWTPLRACLKNGAPGSRILVTTRSTEVAQAVGTTHIHSLKPLSHSYCWSILSHRALEGRAEADREILKETGLEIAKKCKGVPLAANIVGGLLRSKASLQEWQDVLESDIWELEEMRKSLSPLLRLSYNELRPAVKRCFSYCAIFPEDTILDVDKLIRIWMAQGFLSSSKSSANKMEVVGRGYFEELATRSFFQDFVKNDRLFNRVTKCKMHDMVHDFAQLLTENECLIVKRVGGSGGAETISAQNARHLNILQATRRKDDPIGPFSIWQTEKLRSCFLDGNKIPLNLFSYLKRVRTLSLSHCQLEHIPEEIGMLRQVRYLDLRCNRMKDLPGTIYDLYYLQTLNLEGCGSLWGIPAQGIHKLINLRHLLHSKKFEFPDGFEKLTNLRTLTIFHVDEGNKNNKLEWLKDLNQLSGTLCIQITNDVNELQATKADLKSKKFLEELILNAQRVRTEVIEALQPHPNLQILDLRCRHSPTWIITLTQLRKLHLDGGEIADTDLPPIGKLPLLEDVCITKFGVKRVGLDFLGISNATTKSSILPKLKVLTLVDCRFWEEWEDISEEQQNNTNISILPCLLLLQFRSCSKLKALPHRLLRKASSLQWLQIFRCHCLYNRYNRKTGQDWTQLLHIENVEIYS